MGAIRLLLACAVMFSHLSVQIVEPLGMTFDFRLSLGIFGGHAVILFYVISGFLISYVLETKYVYDSRGTYEFYKARFLRIFPLWWVLLLFVVALVANPTWPRGRTLTEFLSVIFLFGTDWIVSFWTFPAPYWLLFPTATGVVWTLGAELTFYAIAPFVLRSLPVTVMLFIASFAFRLGVHAVLGLRQDALYLTWLYFFFPSTMMFFFAGHLTRVLWKKSGADVRHGVWLLIPTTICSLQLIGRPYGNEFMYLTVLFFTLSLPGVFELTKNNRFLNALGDLTYPLYLIHEVCFKVLVSAWSGSLAYLGAWILNFAKTFGTPYSRGMVLMGLLSAFIVGTTFLVHHLVERPAAFLARRLIDYGEASLGRSRHRYRDFAVFLKFDSHAATRHVLTLLSAAAIFGGLYAVQDHWGELQDARKITSSNHQSEGRSVELAVGSKSSRLEDLPPLPSAAKGPSHWDLVEGLLVESMQEPAVAEGQPSLRLTAHEGDGRHAVAARFSGLSSNALYRIAVWVKAAAPVAIMIEARDSIDVASGQPTNYGMAQFDLETRSAIKSAGGFKGYGVEEASRGWLKVWVDLPTKDGQIFVLLGLLERSSNLHRFKAAGQQVVFGGWERMPIH